MFAVIGQPYVPVDELDLQKIRAMNLLAHADLITDTVAQVYFSMRFFLGGFQ